MITRDDKLAIFEDFFVDTNIGKSSSSTRNLDQFDGEDGDTPDVSFMSRTNSGRLSFQGQSRDERALYGEYLDYLLRVNPSMTNKIRRWFAGFFLYKNKPMKNVIKYESIDNFFANVKKAVANLDIIEDDLTFYTDSVKKAFDNNQIALYEILKDRKKAVAREMVLVKVAKESKQSVKYVDEADVVKFYKAVQNNGRFIKLTWLRHYTRTIPDNIIKLKQKFDELRVFDNYVILHFDKTGDASQMTKKEKEKAKDPILFGVMQGSRKLYYVGDWIDEYCDLTLEKFLDTIRQEKAKTVTMTGLKKEFEN